MIIKDLMGLLKSNEDAHLYISLPSGELVPNHFHVTEVGKVQKNFIDCGGVVRENTSCVLQVWTDDDIHHRLKAGKLLKILNLGQKILGDINLPVEIEYGKDVISTYTLAEVKVWETYLILLTSGKQTNCLAPDKCGITKCNGKTNCC